MGDRMRPKLNPRSVHFTDLVPTQHVRCISRREAGFQLLLNLLDPLLPGFAIKASRFVERCLQAQIPRVSSRESKGIKDSVVPQHLARSNCSSSNKYRRRKPIFFQDRKSELIVVAIP